MAVASVNAGQGFRVGLVLYRALRVYGANFAIFFVIAFVAALPCLLVLLAARNEFGTLLFASLLSLFLDTIGAAIILFIAFQYLRGRSIALGAALRLTLARFFPMLGFATLYALGLIAGFFTLAVVSVLLYILWCVALPACVVERLGPIACLGRSCRLIEGHFWKIFGIMLLLTIVWAVGSDTIRHVVMPAGVVARASAEVIWLAVWGAYWNCVSIMIYHDLRVAKEGIDIDQIASNFD